MALCWSPPAARRSRAVFIFCSGTQPRGSGWVAWMFPPGRYAARASTLQERCSLSPDTQRFTLWTRPLENRSEEHTSELQSHSDLVCRLLLEKKNRLTAGSACD